MTYNALDNLAKALDLMEQLKLEAADIRSSMEYNEATGGESWSWNDSQRMELEIMIVQRVIAALANYANGRKDN